MRWEEESEQIRRDVVGRYLYRKGLDPIPIYVSVHKDIAQAFEAFDDHEDFGECAAIFNDKGKKCLPTSPWLLEDCRPFNVKFESELRGDDGALKVFKVLNFNHETLRHVIKEHGDVSNFEKKATAWLKKFECPNKRGQDLHMCWANLCENPKCNIKTHFKRESGLSDFEKLHKIKVPENFMLNHGSYVRYKDGNINRERWKEEFISWGEFLKRHADFCAANQGYYHVYKRYCATTKVPRNFFQNQTEFWFIFWDVVNFIVVLGLDFLEVGLLLGF